MSAFVVQALAAAALFAVIETTEEVLRRLVPGKSNFWYGCFKLAYGLPIVLIAGAQLFGFDGKIHWLAIALGVGAAATIALLFFSAPKEVPK